MSGYKLQAVEWVDSYSFNRWMKPEELDGELIHILTIGHLVAENKKQITIAASVSQSGSIGQEINIPKCAIIRRKTLKGVNRK